MSRTRPPLPPGPLVIDGGLSTQLERQGCDVSGVLWTAQLLVESPATVMSAHQAFIDAGADIVITASYQVSRQGFVESGRLASEADEALLTSLKGGQPWWPPVLGLTAPSCMTDRSIAAATACHIGNSWISIGRDLMS